ncbi:hypothetical protein GCM10027614_01520 [Micromonospora vulcania]
MTTNPLVATASDTAPSAWAGIWICEDIELIAQGVRNGSWIDGSLGVVSAGLDGLAFVSDPVGALLQYGIAWLIEHVKPLSEALDWLAGNPAEITAHAQTWRNVAASLRQEAAGLAGAVRADVAGWGGSAGPAYRAWARSRHRPSPGSPRAPTPWPRSPRAPRAWSPPSDCWSATPSPPASRASSCTRANWSSPAGSPRHLSQSRSPRRWRRGRHGSLDCCGACWPVCGDCCRQSADSAT